MRFIKVDSAEIEIVKPRYSLKAEFTEFMNMNVKAARCRLDKDHYSSIKVAYATLWKAAKHHAFPIKPIMRKDEIYLVRTDM